jgi:hypothetical protein
VANICTEPCRTHEDCGNSAYCDYKKVLKLGNKSINFIGICHYLADGTSRKNECNSTSDCPSTTVVVSGIDRHYECLNYVDENDAVKGVCGIERLVSGAIPSSEAKPCNTQNRYCESGLCVSLTDFQLTTSEGKCRELCSSTAQCSQVVENNMIQNQICRRVKFRDGALQTGNNKEAYGSICLPVGTSSFENCKTSNCSDSNETCILNPVNAHSNENEPWKFDIEYLCVLKNLAGADFGVTCNKDSDCASNLCSVTSHKCTVACTTNAQCSGLGNETCNLNYPVVHDDPNSANWVRGGVCE